MGISEALAVRSNVRFKGIRAVVDQTRPSDTIKTVDNGAKVDTLQALTYHQVYFPAESFL